MISDTFSAEITPFFFINHGSSYSTCLNVGSYKTEIFLARESEGFIGNGYDWVSLAEVFLNEKVPVLKDIIHFDPEADMFTAYSSDEDALKKFTLLFKEACENSVLITDLFSRAELD